MKQRFLAISHVAVAVAISAARPAWAQETPAETSATSPGDTPVSTPPEAVPEPPADLSVGSGIDETLALDIHGYGGWAAGYTNRNVYLAGSSRGSYERVDMALSIAARLGKLRVVAQPRWSVNEYGDVNGGTPQLRVSLDYAFAEWTFSDTFRFRAGRIKQAFGLSSEVFRVGTLRPFLDLPQGVYGPVGLVGLAYEGFGITGSVRLADDLTLTYDLYGGGMIIEEYQPPEAAVLGETLAADRSIEQEVTRTAIGGRADLWFSDFRVGASAYSGKEGDIRRYVYGAHAAYETARWLLRTEYAHEEADGDLKVNGAYVEGAVRFGPLQLAVQGDYLTTKLAEAPSPPPELRSLLDHKELVAGINYWFSGDFVIKLSAHHVVGNRFAAPTPQTLFAMTDQGLAPNKTTDLLQLGANFSF